MAGSDLFTGTLDILILKALTWGPRHGYAIGRWIRETTEDVLAVHHVASYVAEHLCGGGRCADGDDLHHRAFAVGDDELLARIRDPAQVSQQLRFQHDLRDLEHGTYDHGRGMAILGLASLAVGPWRFDTVARRSG